MSSIELVIAKCGGDIVLAEEEAKKPDEGEEKKPDEGEEKKE